MSTETDPGEPAAGWERWRASRLADVNAPDGPPTLVATTWLDETDSVAGVPGTWSTRGDEAVLTLPDGAAVTLAPGERAALDGVSVQLTVRGGRSGIRVFDHARAGAVDGIGAFEPSSAWVVEGRFAPLPTETTESYGHALESQPRELAVPGTVSFALGGRDYETRPLLDDDALLLVFADGTTGEQTKPPSRFLRVALPAGGAGEPGAVTLDFNRAYLPPCAFSDEFNCPLPPVGHRFDVAVTAGETWPRPAVD